MIKESRQEEIMQQHAKSGKFGKQTLQEIQGENRRLIICASHKTDDINIALDRASYCPKVNIYGLNWVLLALKVSDDDELFMSNSGKYLRIPTSNGATIFWDLEKETLELQEEIVQRSINKLLKEDNGNTFKAY